MNSYGNKHLAIIYYRKIADTIYLYIGVYYPTKNSLPVIVMEKMQYSLRGLVEGRSNLQWENKLSILNDVCFGLQYLHTRTPPIVHRDLTPNNILLCYHFRAKIADLGVAKVMHGTNTNTLTQVPGTSDFMPPESLANQPVYGLPLDIFSFGGVILYVCTQEWPHPAPLVDFDPETGKRIISESTELERRQHYLDKMVGVYADLKSLVTSCLDDNPKKRPEVGKALLEIKQVKNAYNEKMYFTVSTTDKWSSMQKEQEQPQPQHQQDQPQPPPGQKQEQSSPEQQQEQSSPEQQQEQSQPQHQQDQPQPPPEQQQDQPQPPPEQKQEQSSPEQKQEQSPPEQKQEQSPPEQKQEQSPPEQQQEQLPSEQQQV